MDFNALVNAALSRWPVRFGMLGVAAGALAGCQDTGSGYNARARQPIPSQTIALMESKGTAASAPTLIRTYKKEAELEVWKQKSDGRYALVKTYPMCRWSGQLGPKTREGDRQVPEGFYAIAPGQMNPNSAYYLSFNVGYPNAYDRVHGFTGGAIMVHGVCSSAGCFSMTDEQIAEIYAIARESFAGGQRAIQMQSMPFRMTPENLAKYRLDPNMKFWKEIKEGADHFEVTQREPQVGLCDGHYTFDSGASCGGQAPSALMTAVRARQSEEAMQVATLVASGVKPIRTYYADGGQNEKFASTVFDVSRPDALAAGPTEISLDDKGKPVPAVVQIAAAKTKANAPVTTASIPAPTAIVASTTTVAAAATPTPASDKPATDKEGRPFYSRWFGGLGGSSEAAPDATLAQPANPQPAIVPLPPRRQAAVPVKAKPQAALTTGATLMASAGSLPTR